MSILKFDFNNIVGKIKPMHCIGQPPVIGDSNGAGDKYFHYLEEAHIPYSRLHDVGGWFGGNMYVDIPNLFRDFDADENDPGSYDFTFTDILIKKLVAYNCQPYFRLGVTIENFHAVKAYRIFPPKDFKKWARICEHVIRYYNEGWANGFHYDIAYWEIWNEPDNGFSIEQNAMWKGTKEQYFELYRVTSRHLRACFGDSIKIGGYASCGFYAITEERTVGSMAMGGNVEPTDWEKRIIGFVEFFQEFLDIVKKENLPLDFFSHHSYSNVSKTLKMQKYVEEELQKAGLGEIDIHLNEWNTNANARGTSIASCGAAAMMCAMQDTKMSLMCYYDARIGVSIYGGLFNPFTREPFCTYYSLKAFGKLYEMGQEATVTGAGDDLYALAATDGKRYGVLIANEGADRTVKTNLLNEFKAYRIDETHMMTQVELKVTAFEMKHCDTFYLEYTHDE